jgi:two-component system, cell cycle sensor histidine kinase and response regulator CckA
LNTNDESTEQANRVLIHDFRNLLAVIVNYSELIAEETEDAQAVRTDIVEIRTAAERAIALTDKLRRALLNTTESPDETPPASAS